jgi:hypothetical protein
VPRHGGRRASLVVHTGEPRLDVLAGDRRDVGGHPMACQVGGESLAGLAVAGDRPRRQVVGTQLPGPVAEQGRLVVDEAAYGCSWTDSTFLYQRCAGPNTHVLAGERGCTQHVRTRTLQCWLMVSHRCRSRGCTPRSGGMGTAIDGAERVWVVLYGRCDVDRIRAYAPSGRRALRRVHRTPCGLPDLARTPHVGQRVGRDEVAAFLAGSAATGRCRCACSTCSARRCP